MVAATQAAEDAQRHRDEEQKEAVDEAAMDTTGGTGGKGSGSSKSRGKEATPRKKKTPAAPAPSPGASRKGEKAAVAMEVGGGSDSEEEAVVTLPGSEFGKTAAAGGGDAAAQGGKAREKTKSRPAPVSDAWEDDEEGGGVEDLRDAVKKPKGGAKKRKVPKKR